MGWKKSQLLLSIVLIIVISQVSAQSLILGNEEYIIINSVNPEQHIAQINPLIQTTQIDSELAAIHNIEESLSIILGDQTLTLTIEKKEDLLPKIILGKDALSNALVNPHKSFITTPMIDTTLSSRAIALIQSTTMRKLLMIPMLTMLIIFSRHLLGIRTYGLFGPIVIAISLIEFEIFFGVLFYIVLLAIGAGIKKLISRYQFPLITEVSLLMFGSSIVIYLFSLLHGAITAEFQRILFPLIITAFIVERFYQTTEAHTPIEASSLLMITLLFAMVLAIIGKGLLLISNELFIVLFFLSVIAIIAISKYVGLRLTEKGRFKFV